MFKSAGMMKSIIKVIAFLLILSLTVFSVNRVLMLKNASTQLVQVFYERPENSIDVLFLGSSHTYVNVDTGVLWDEQGIASYDLASSLQPLWSTYFYLKEALKTQRPKLIVLDVYQSVEEDDYLSSQCVYWNVAGLRFSLNKLSSIAVSTPQKKDFLLGLPIYHSRYSELTKADYLGLNADKDRSSWNGFTPYFEVCDREREPDFSLTSDLKPLSEKTEKYLRKIIEFAQIEKIPLLLVNAPYPQNEEEQAVFNSVATIADEYNVPFLSSGELSEGASLNFTGDECDLSVGNHLNYRGAAKYSSYLGRYIKENYPIPDRRDDEGYDSWQVDADNLRATIEDFEISGTESFLDWFEEVLDEKRFTLVINFATGSSEDNDMDSVLPSLRSRGLDLTEGETRDGFVAVLRDGDVVCASSSSDFLWHESLFSSELMVRGSGPNAVMRLGYTSYAALEDGVTVLLYDDLTGSLIEVSGWNGGLFGEKEAIAVA